MPKIDLTSGVFLAKGASVQCGGSKMGHQFNPHSSYARFRNNRYFKSEPTKNNPNWSVEFIEKSK